MATTSFRIEQDLLDQLKVIAKDEGRSLKITIERILEDYRRKWRAGKGADDV